MQVRLDHPVSYSLPLGNEAVALNEFIKKKITLEFSGKINCVHCGRNTNKSFSQGYCYPCFQKLAQCDSCIISPEKCHYEAGTCREPLWGDKFCMQDHIVYLANSSGIKVGITRASQVPTRWIDQGAVQALPVFRVRTRQQSGFIELLFKQHISDKTNWRIMLKGGIEELDMEQHKQQLLKECAEDIQAMQDRFGIHAISILTGMHTVSIDYPVENYPTTVTSLNFDKTPKIEGTLQGIKGQYLILDTGVLNIRKFGGYDITLTV
ncbi:DUF2797 domain-containing protein [Haliea sp. AH-315-K21]|uniref:DUF2797 domain-containing protein n=1 Tax=SAR86 cluster bacterium TaxID=2030880 RepID=A0A2A5C899_9GAMM|nr:DUF2797 domain-containing protein [Haliea sp. AH-315-K21]PCJ40037.1 MAG: hypothetical protein COA71_12485 [SAR86 cluster bacterium]